MEWVPHLGVGLAWRSSPFNAGLIADDARHVGSRLLTRHRADVVAGPVLCAVEHVLESNLPQAVTPEPNR